MKPSKVKIIKIGKSFGFLIPKKIVKKEKLRAGNTVIVELFKRK